MRMIDADALLTKAKDVLITDGKGNCAKYRCIDTYHVQTAPTIEQPQVVRCRDCKTRPHCLKFDYCDDDNWFCADGKPKDGEAD